jgi:hypothetical protein
MSFPLRQVGTVQPGSDAPNAQQKSAEWCHPLLESTGRSVDKQANRRTRAVPRATLNQDRLNASLGVPSFLKVIAITYCSKYLCTPANLHGSQDLLVRPLASESSLELN